MNRLTVQKLESSLLSLARRSIIQIRPAISINSKSTRNLCSTLIISNLNIHRSNNRNNKSSLVDFQARRMLQNNSSSSSNKTDQESQQQSPAEKPKFIATKEELKARLSPIQFEVTQLKGTERPFTGEYNKFDKKGTYHCVVCEESLFESDTKFDSGCGWPAFFDSIDKQKLKFVQDHSLVGAANLLRLAKNSDLVRTEVLCKNCDAHLGHVFDDGPLSKGGKRYCINSAALRFEPAKSVNDN